MKILLTGATGYIGKRLLPVLPACPLGDVAHRVFVQKQLEGIFSYREEVLVHKFGRP